MPLVRITVRTVYVFRNCLSFVIKKQKKLSISNARNGRARSFYD